ncbi:MAG: hypothetical protein ACRDLF_06195 [Solirubrobacteraceae bacterium]
MSKRATANADLLQAELFTPSGGKRYLLAAFSQPRSTRREHLEDAAAWLGLDAVLLNAADSAANIRADIETRWLELLGLCESRLHSQGDRGDLRALIGALQGQYASADASGEPVTLEKLWKAAGRLSSTARRGRRWIALRKEIATVLAELVARATPKSLLPRPPREPRMFDDSSLKTIAERLREARSSGMVVLGDNPGSGRSEVALAFAHEYSQAYDRVFVLRGTDQERLEQDYMTLACLVAGDTGDRVYLRRKALEYLEENDRWLIVFLSVVDPAILLPFVPWRNRGHTLCTTAIAAGGAESPDNPWLKYFSVEPTRLEEVASFDARSVLEHEFPPELHGEHALERLIDEVGRSRLSTALALAWFTYTKPATPPDGPAASKRRQLAAYLEHWDNTETKDGKDAAARAAARAAEVQLRELFAQTRWRPAAEVANDKLELERDAFELLCRLTPFVKKDAEGLTAETFQTVLLDHPKYDVPDRIKDRRLVLIDELGLADRHDSITRPYFHINAAVLKAVDTFSGAKPHVEHALESALSTLLRLLTHSPADRDFADLTFELLPHIKALAKRTSDAKREKPFIAPELHAYAALSYLNRRRPRHAELELDRMKDLLKGLNKDLLKKPNKDKAVISNHAEDWEALGDELHPDDPFKRMGKLVRALRTAGFPQQAVTYFKRLKPIVKRSAADPATTAYQLHQIARLRFEAALAYHDLDQIQHSAAFLDQARRQWTHAGEEVCTAMGQSFAAELELDRGNVAAARRMGEQARASRRRLLDTGVSDQQSGLADIARSDHLLGLIDYSEGRFTEAREHLCKSVEGWEQAFAAVVEGGRGPRPPHYGRLNQITSRSYLALMYALLGEGLAAEEEADNVWHELRTTPHRSHAAAVIGSNVAQVYRLCGRVDEAVRVHREALNEAERAWPTGSHRAERLIRREYADSLLDAGRPTEALEVLNHLLGEAPPSSAGATWKVGTARTLSSLGRLFIESSLSMPPLLAKSDRDLAYLDVAHRVLLDARSLFEATATETRAPNPAMLGCLLGLTEVAIRTGDGSTASALAGKALELARAQYPGKPPLATAIARRARAEALLAPDSRERLTALAGELEPYSSCKEGNPTDRFEIALARVDVQAHLWLLEPSRRPKDPIEAAKQWLEAPLEGYPSIGVGQQHQLSARVYAELAALAQRLQLAEQRRGRLVRERDRLRPAFSPKVNDLLYEIASRRHLLTVMS